MRGLEALVKRAETNKLRQEYLRRIDAEAVLEHYGAGNAHRKGDEIIHSCLLDRVDPHHAHGDQNPSASINVSNKLYHCYSYGGGDIFWLILKLEGKEEFWEIVPKLSPFLGSATQSAEDFLEEIGRFFRTEEAEAATPIYNERVLRQWDLYHPYLRSRGISVEAAQRLWLGYDERRRRITIPHWVDGKLVGWQARAQTDRRWPVTEVERRPDGSPLDGGRIPKYKNSSAFPKDTTIYNLDRVLERGYRDLIVVESAMSVAKAETLWSGEPDDPLGGVVSTFSGNVGRKQLERLRPFRSITVWFDDDYSGYHGAYTVLKGLYRFLTTYYIAPAQDRDLGDIDDVSEARAMIDSRKIGVLALPELEVNYGRRRK